MAGVAADDLVDLVIHRNRQRLAKLVFGHYGFSVDAARVLYHPLAAEAAVNGQKDAPRMVADDEIPGIGGVDVDAAGHP